MKFLKLFLLLLIISGPAWGASKILDIQFEGESAVSKKRLLHLIPLQPGEPFDAAKLAKGVEYIRELQIFEGVEARTEIKPEGILILIKLSEAKVISSINLTGHYPYIEAKIRKRLDIQVGEIWDPVRIEEQKKRILRFFERQGYYNTTIDVRTKPTERKKHIHVIFDIDKGDRLRIGNIIYTGNLSIGTGGLYAFIRPMGIYSEPHMKNALRDLIQYYRNRGYLRVKAHIVTQNIDWEKNRVSLQINIIEGPKVKVFFRGKKYYGKKTLKETITLFREGDFNSIELKDSRIALRNRLKKDGFPSPKVRTEQKKINPNLYHITFYINSGQRILIQEINFEGNEALSDRKIKKNLLTQEHSLTQKGVLNEESLVEDKKLAKEVYLSEGYPDVKISDPKIELSPTKTRYRINFQVEEGMLVRVRKIDFTGGNPPFEKEILKTLVNKQGEPFNQAILETEKEQVELFYKNRGYPYVEVNQKVEALEKTNTVDIHYTIEPSYFVTIGEIIFIGDVLTSVRSMKQSLGIKNGDPYSEEKLLQAELNLRRTGAFTAVKVESLGLDEKARIVHLVVKVEERPPFVLDFQTQYSTDQQYSGAFLFTNFNTFGWAKQTRLALTGGIKKNRAELSWLDPRLGGSDFQMTLGSWLNYEKRSIDTTVQEGGSVSFFRQYRRFGFLTHYQLTRTYVLEGQAADPRSRRDSILSEIGVSESYDRRDSYSDPRKGFFSLVGVKIFNEISGARADFAKLKGAHSHYWSPFQLLTLSSTFRIDRIQDLINAASIPQQELLGFGGDDTVRGFREDRAGPLNAAGLPLGGRTRIIFNEEMEIRLASSFKMALFYDAGSLTQGWNDIGLDSYRNSYGFGLRYVTPVGPIRADYGIILDRQPNENFGRFHLTFGYLF